jgi:hypothetical protein
MKNKYLVSNEVVYSHLPYSISVFNPIETEKEKKNLLVLIHTSYQITRRAGRENTQHFSRGRTSGRQEPAARYGRTEPRSRSVGGRPAASAVAYAEPRRLEGGRRGACTEPRKAAGSLRGGGLGPLGGWRRGDLVSGLPTPLRTAAVRVEWGESGQKDPQCLELGLELWA